MRRVAVIGGGFAGLAAAVRLSEAGWAVTVLEARPHLGGRAYSFEDEASGTVVDNGQHAMMGCYTETLGFLERIGATHKVSRQPNMRVEMADRRRGSGVIAFAALPSPLHALGGILGYRLLSVPERLAALLAGVRLMAMRRGSDERLSALSVDELLVALGQSARARESFWNPIALSTVNELPERAAAVSFVEVLARAFFASRAASQFVLPNVGLSELYTGDARRFIEARGGRVETCAAVASLETTGSVVSGLRLRDGRTIGTDACIGAVPPAALARILPAQLRDGKAGTSLAEFRPSPIVSAHLWFDRPVLRGEFLGMLGTTTQFAFNRNAIAPARGNNVTYAVSTVVSAGHQLVDCDNASIVGTAVADLRCVLPDAVGAKLLRAVVVKEKHATISLTPQAERMRPECVTPLANFFLAGDWTRTGLPATIESAVVSGHRAADRVARLAEPLRAA